jgi:uncharacterized protein YjbI with pentapeptide repeats
MGLPAWLGLSERRWKKTSDEEIQPAKTVWDFLQLLIVPAILVAIALAFNAAQSSREQKHQDAQIRADRASAEAAREDTTLDSYFGRMSDLMLDKKLLSSKRGSAVREVARTETLASLRRLDGARKAQVVRFLYEAGLIGVKTTFVALDGTPELTDWAGPVITLDGADLRGADFRGARIDGKDADHQVLLAGDLRGARFDGAHLYFVIFDRAAILDGATFDRADLYSTSFFDAHVSNASFRHAILYDDSFGSYLVGTRFDHSRFGTTVEGSVNEFFGACLTRVSFASVLFESYGVTDLHRSVGHDLDFSNARLRGSVILSSKLKRLKLDGVHGHFVFRPVSKVYAGDYEFACAP